MDARRLFITPIIAGAVLAAAIFGIQAQVASAEVPLPQVSPYLRAAIEADIEARGYKYAGDIRFDSMYAAPGDWVSSVQSVGPDGAVVTYGKFASDEIITVKFVSKGNYGWVNPDTGVGSPERVPVLGAQPGTAPHSWVVEGMDFPPNSDVALFDGTAGGGEQRVPTDHTLYVGKTDATGHFRVTVTFTSQAVPGQVHRLIQASGGAFLQVRFDQEATGQPAPSEPSPTQPSPTQPSPTQPAPAEPTKPAPTKPVPTKPAPVDPTPETPAVEDDEDDNALAYAAIAGLGLAAIAGGFGIVTVARRR
jgi:hypothetical protein